MNKERKYISQPLAKKIQDKAKEKGFELPESEMWWGSDKKLYYRFDKSIVDFEQQILVKKSYFDDTFEWCQTYDTSELGEMLPGNIGGCSFQMQKGLLGNRYYCIMKRMGDKKIIEEKDEKTMAEAMGKMFYYLLSNDLL